MHPQVSYICFVLLMLPPVGLGLLRIDVLINYLGFPTVAKLGILTLAGCCFFFFWVGGRGGVGVGDAKISNKLLFLQNLWISSQDVKFPLCPLVSPLFLIKSEPFHMGSIPMCIIKCLQKCQCLAHDIFFMICIAIYIILPIHVSTLACSPVLQNKLDQLFRRGWKYSCWTGALCDRHCYWSSSLRRSIFLCFVCDMLR